MRDRILRRRVAALAAVVTLPLSSLSAQELPKGGDDSFEVEPPLLIPPSEPGSGLNASRDEPADVGKLTRQLAQARESAASGKRLVKSGVLAQTEAEQRALRAIRLESELANAQVTAAQAQIAAQKARGAANPASGADLDAALEALTRASAAAQTAKENYRKAQLDAAALNLRRQRQLLALGSAHKSDVSRAEEKLDRLQQSDSASP